MTQEEKSLLLKDLCARLPYGVICYNSNTESNFKLCDVADIDSGYPTFDYGYGELETVKPYLRPMASMTEEEIEELNNLLDKELKDSEPYFVYEQLTVDFYLRHHLDNRLMIEKGLALEATEGMYK